MKKPITRIIKTVIPAQDASVTSPIGPLLGQYGANIKEFCQKFNEFTQKYDENMNLMVNIIVYKDKTVNFEILNVVGSFLIFEEQYIYDKEKEEDENEEHDENILNKTDESFTQVLLFDNFKDLLKNKGEKIVYFFDVIPNLFFFIEFILFYLSKKTFNDYFSQINFFFDFFATGRFLKKTKKIKKFEKILVKKNKSEKNLRKFFLEVDEFINPLRFKKRKSFFMQAGEDEEKKEKEKEEEEENTKSIDEEGNTLLDKNLKYFDLEKLEYFKKQEEMKKKKKPKNVSRIVKMAKYADEDIVKDKNSNITEENDELDLENDEYFFYIPKTINLSVLYKVVKFKHYYNKDVEEKTLFRILASTIISMDIKIVDDIF